jgi:outer membrane protein assembly factor BamB
MISMHKCVPVVLLVLLAGCATEGAQTPSPAIPASALPTAGPNTWARTFAGPDYGAWFDIAITPDEGILAVGSTNHLHMPPYSGDALYMKLTLGGEVLWGRTWGGDGYEQARSVAFAEDGGFYVFGETDSHGAGDRDFFLLKLSPDGGEEWFRTYGRERREWPYGMLRLANQDLLIFGFSEAPAGGARNQYAVRVRPDGEVVWEYLGQGAGEQIVHGALEGSDGTLVLAVSMDEDGALVKLDANGNLLWTRRYELEGWQFASLLAPADEDGFLLAGFSMSSSPQQADTWLARCGPDGELEWQTSFGDPAFDDYATSLIRLKDGTYLMGAIANGVLLSRVDEDGALLWRQSLLGQTVYGVMALKELEPGGFLVAGLSELVSGRSYDAILLRTDENGRITD